MYVDTKQSIFTQQSLDEKDSNQVNVIVRGENYLLFKKSLFVQDGINSVFCIKKDSDCLPS